MKSAIPPLDPTANSCSCANMSRLARYIILQSAKGAISLFLVAAFLVWLTQMLRIFDLVTAKGQDMFTLAGQAFLTTAPLALQIIYICVGIGMARAFRSLQLSRELHIIHISKRTGAIWSGVFLFAIMGALVALLFANFIEPLAKRTATAWSAQIAVDLLGRALTPKRFTEISKGVVLYIGDRNKNGTIENFFAYDSRNPDFKRTYSAKSAIIIAGKDGFQISLSNGRFQIIPKGGKYSEVAFSRYDLSVNELIKEPKPQNPKDNRNTWQIVQAAIAAGKMTPSIVNQLAQRMAEGVRVIGISLLIASLVAFPHARRKRELFPSELGVLALAFAERFLSNGAPDWLPFWGYYLGPTLMIGAAILILSWRMAGYRLLPAYKGARP